MRAVSATDRACAWTAAPPAGGAALLSTSVAASHGVLAPVLVVGFAVVPVAVRTRSWASSSMSPVGETLVRTV